MNTNEKSHKLCPPVANQEVNCHSQTIISPKNRRKQPPPPPRQRSCNNRHPPSKPNGENHCKISLSTLPCDNKIKHSNLSVEGNHSKKKTLQNSHKTKMANNNKKNFSKISTEENKVSQKTPIPINKTTNNNDTKQPEEVPISESNKVPNPKKN